VKAGTYYTDFVGRVLAALEPGYTVRTGEWIEGPDGRRDMDVEVRGAREGVPHFCLVECKDWRRKVGIPVVDALDSKRADLKADRAIIYSNSGFTRQAVRKARRIGVELASAVCEHDPKIKPQLRTKVVLPAYGPFDEMIRLMVVGETHPPAPFGIADIFFEDLPLQNWLHTLSVWLIKPAEKPSSVEVKFTFHKYEIFVVRGQPVWVAGFHVFLRYRRHMISQDIPITVSRGAYDFTHGRLLLPPSESIGWVFSNKKWVDEPPDAVETMGATSEQVTLSMSLISGTPEHDISGVPDVDPLIRECQLISRTSE
jgi:hypothetical protein